MPLQVDLSKPVGPYKPIYSWFGYDEANYTTMRHGKKLLRELHDLSPVPVYIRAHHLLTSRQRRGGAEVELDQCVQRRCERQAGYDFKILDGIFDEYKAAGVRPMVELGFMPEDLAADLPDRHEPYQVHYPQSDDLRQVNNPPKDYAKWGELVRVVTAHLVSAMGKETVLQWYFEVGTSRTSTTGMPRRRSTGSCTTTRWRACGRRCRGRRWAGRRRRARAGEGVHVSQELSGACEQR